MAFQGNAFQGNAFQKGPTNRTNARLTQLHPAGYGTRRYGSFAGRGAAGNNVTMDAASASYTYTATAATFDTSLLVASASHAYTANAATFDTSLLVASASYTYTANSITFDTSLLTGSASYAYTASASTFDTSMLAASAAYVWTANDADLVVQAGNDVVMNADSASYSYTAQAATFDTSLSAATAAVAWTANDVTFDLVRAEVDDDIFLGTGGYQGLRHRILGDRRKDKQWRKRRRQIEQIGQEVEDIANAVPADVPEAAVARQAQAAVAQAFVGLARPTIDYAALADDLRRARAALQQAEQAYRDYLEEEEEDEFLLLNS